MARIKKTHNSGKPSSSVWVKNWHMIPCCNCMTPTKAPRECPKILCGWCIVSDPLNGFAAFSGKKYKTFRMAKKYLEMTSKKKLQTDQDEPTLAKQGQSNNRKTFASAAKELKAKGKL